MLIRTVESSLAAHPSLIPSLPAWNILNDPEHREKVLIDTDTNFPGLKSLDPVRMNISDLFSSILTIKNAQDEGRSLLKFTIPKDLSLATELFQDGEIVELGSSPKSRASSHILSQQLPSSAKPAGTHKHTLVDIPDFSLLPNLNVSSADVNPEKRKKRKTDVGDDVNVQSNQPATKKQRIEEVILPRTSSR